MVVKQTWADRFKPTPYISPIIADFFAEKG